MKITSINSINLYSNNKEKRNRKQADKINQISRISFGKFPQFFKQEKAVTLPVDYEDRLKKLEDLNIDPVYAKRIAKLDSSQYQRALDLIKQDVFEQSILHVAQLDENRYKQAQSLIKMGIIDNNLSPLANNDSEVFSRITELRKNGIHIDYLTLFASLEQVQYEKAINLIKQGWQQNIAAYIVQLSKPQQEIFLKFVNEGTYAPLAFEVAKQKKNVRARTLDYIEKGASVPYALEIAELRRKERKKALKLFSLNIGDSNISNFAKLKGANEKRAFELFNQGVLPEYITDIILVERGLLENKEYMEYISKGYSHSSAYAISLLREEEVAQLRNLEIKFPEIKNFYKQNYDVFIVENQLTDENDDEVIFFKDIRLPDGTTITLVKTFSEDGTITESRSEKYKDGSTSSIMKNANRVLRIKYDKTEQIQEVLHILEDEETKGVIGAIYSKTSDTLPGVFESTYYDISAFRQDNSTDDIVMDFDISNMINGSGIELSKVSRNYDGSISFKEKYNTNDCTIERIYREKKDESGNITEGSYSYKITHDNGRVLMDVSRSREISYGGVIYNTINGIEYRLFIDDENKSITISDNKNEKKLDFKNILPVYSQKQIWSTIKNQDVDTLLLIADFVDKWSYCNESDSQIYRHINEICTGQSTSVIAHEVGHIIQKILPDITYNLEFLVAYDEEMTNFMTNFPFSEQEHIQYFTPRADLTDSIGYEEFISEANLLLTTYGCSLPSLRSRSQILARYFPRTIAIVADMLGKTSQKSLLEDYV